MCLQLPDYHDIIEHPMDFGTVRKKLNQGEYANLEQFEVCTKFSLSMHLYLLCS
jgi:Bromodomain